MYQKILIPLDGSKEAEAVLPIVEDIVTPGGERILLQIIPPGRSLVSGELVILASQQEEADRAKANSYLRHVGLTGQLNAVSGPWRFEVVVSGSVAEGIVNFAVQEEVDLIAMYTHDRKGLAKLIKGSIAEKVRDRAPVEVRVLKPRELVAR